MGIVAYVHTSHVLIPLFAELSRREMPDIEVFHMVDESLIKNTIREKKLSNTTIRRVVSMVESAHAGGADAVVVTCSSIGPAASISQRLFDFPVVRVDEAMAELAVCSGRRIGVAATLKTTLEPTLALVREKAAAAGRDVKVIDSLCAGAFEALLAGDAAAHDCMLADFLTRLVTEVDVVVLAQASMARVVEKLPPDPARVPILSSPALAVRSVRSVFYPELAVPVS